MLQVPILKAIGNSKALSTGYLKTARPTGQLLLISRGNRTSFIITALPAGGSHRRAVCVDYLYYTADHAIQPVLMTKEGIVDADL